MHIHTRHAYTHVHYTVCVFGQRRLPRYYYHIHTHTCKHPHTHTHAHAHVHTHTHTHTHTNTHTSVKETIQPTGTKALLYLNRLLFISHYYVCHRVPITFILPWSENTVVHLLMPGADLGFAERGG